MAGDYNAEFFSIRQPGSRRSAEAILSVVLPMLKPTSAVDVGCGSGEWTRALAQTVDDVVGVDGDWVPAESRGPWFQPQDLERRLSLDRKFDLALSMEVAEHLPPARAAGFVADLVALAPAVLFSAAIPGQGGTSHVNEQWQSYWSALFGQRGYFAHDVIRPRIWDDASIDPWYAQNTLLYLPTEAPAQGPLDVVHPRLWERKRRNSTLRAQANLITRRGVSRAKRVVQSLRA